MYRQSLQTVALWIKQETPSIVPIFTLVRIQHVLTLCSITCLLFDPGRGDHLAGQAVEKGVVLQKPSSVSLRKGWILDRQRQQFPEPPLENVWMGVVQGGVGKVLDVMAEPRN